jgi:hypothetical protein
MKEDILREGTRLQLDMEKNLFSPMALHAHVENVSNTTWYIWLIWSDKVFDIDDARLCT